MYRNSELTSAIVRAPMVRVVLPFMIGLLLANGQGIPLAWIWGVVIASLIWSYLFWTTRLAFSWRWLPGIAFMLAFLALGVLRQRLASVELREGSVGSLIRSADGFEVQVEEMSSVKERSIRAWVDVRSALMEGRAEPAHGRLLLTLMRDSIRSVPKKGDLLLVSGHPEAIDRVPDPGGFDQRKWAAYHGSTAALFATAGHWKLLKGNERAPGFFDAASTRVAQWLHDAGLPPREGALAKAILLGLRDELEPEQNQAFVRSGTIHVLAVSGSHVGIIFIALTGAFAWIGKGRWPRILRGCLILAALWSYAGLTGFTPSVLRATVMFTLFTIAEMVRWRIDSLNSLAAAAFLLLMWDPSMLGQLGFQLSFLAVLGIIVFYRKIHTLWAPPDRVSRFFWSLLAVSLAAQGFTVPLCLFTFHAFPVWFLPANMAIVGLVGLGVYGAFAVVIFHAVPVLGPMLSLALKGLLVLLGSATVFFSSLPAAYPAVRIGWWGMMGMYLLLAFFSAWVMLGSRIARTATFAALAVLLCGWAWTAHGRSAQRGLTVYDDREVTMVSVLRGRTLVVYRTAASERSDRKIEDHCRIAGIRQVMVHDSLPQWIQAGEDRIGSFRVDRPMPGPIDPATTLMVFYGGDRMDRGFTADLSKGASPPCVLAADLRPYARNKVREWVGTGSVPVHDMREEGAYVVP